MTVVNRLGSAVGQPLELAFKNSEPGYPEIGRVGKIRADCTIMRGYKASEYWHSDRDFWPEQKNFIVNWLYSKVVPESDGETAFLDLQYIFYQLYEEEKRKFLRLKFSIDLNEISDHKGINPKE